VSGVCQRSLGALVACVALLMGCVTRGPVDDPALIRKLGFLEAGGATRSEVEARLGAPVHTYESGRIATYTIGEREGHLSTDPSRYSTTYTLVIEYAPDGTIARRSLVRLVK
jgi:hypothetical protein